MMLAAAGLAISPVASNAASSLSIVRAAPQLAGASLLQDDDEHHSRRGVAVILGVVLIVLIGAAAISGNGKNPTNSP